MNEKIIWDFIYGKSNNAYGTAALMGNLMAESSLNPLCVTGIKDPNYVFNADAGIIDFAHDGHAFGLVQWCYRTRKAGLLDYSKSKGISVGSIDIQLEYMWKELQESYKTCYKAIMSAKNIREVSDIIMLKYEKPANVSEAMKKRRADFGQAYFDVFASFIPQDKPGENEQKTATKKVLVTTDRTNIRAGNEKNFPRITQVNKNAMYEWVATSENGWYAIRLPGRVAWISKEFSKLI